MFELTFSEKINDDMTSSINYIKNILKAPNGKKIYADIYN
jgi:hypothetical protein